MNFAEPRRALPVAKRCNVKFQRMKTLMNEISLGPLAEEAWYGGSDVAHLLLKHAPSMTLDRAWASTKFWTACSLVKGSSPTFGTKILSVSSEDCQKRKS